MRRQSRHNQAESGILAAVAALFLTLILPLQTYLANPAMFDFGAWAVLRDGLPFAFLVFTALFAALVLAGRLRRGRILPVVTLALLLCAYLESGPFSIGLPPLDGDQRAFENPFRIVIDTGLLVATLVLVVGLYRWIKSSVLWIALAVLVLSVASLFDVRPEQNGSSLGPLADGYCPQYDIVRSASFSPKRNVILLILDTFEAAMAAEAVRRQPELKAHFPGFVAYENNLAMHEMTSRALPGLMTGKYLSPDQYASDFSSTMFGVDSFLFPYVRAGHAVYFSDQLLPYGYTNRRAGDFENVTAHLNKTGSVLLRNSNLIPYVSLFDVILFRLAPYRFKSRVLRAVCDRALAKAPRHGAEVYCEDRLYPILAAAPATNAATTALLVFHTTGSHGPIVRARDGSRLPEPTQDIDAYCEYSVYVLEQVAKFMDALRARGLYDGSTIVLAADHGFIDIPGLKRMARGETSELLLHGAESAILWVKPPHARDAYSTSALPTSNCKLSELFKTLATRDLTQADAANILRATDRRFIAKFGTAWYSMDRYVNYSEWRYDDAGNVIAIENKGIWKAN